MTNLFAAAGFWIGRAVWRAAGVGGCLLVICLGASEGRGAPGDEHWDRQFGWPGTSNFNFTVREHEGKLYTGGFNPVAPGSTNSPVNVWDGTRWSTLGMVGGSLAVPYAIEFVGNNIYVGGLFSSVNGVSAVGLARWNGSAWSAVGTFAGAVFALATDGANLFVGGTFTNAGGIIVTNVARWDGTAWSAMGAGLGTYPTSDTGGVAALLCSGSELYAGGGFTNSGPAPVAALARWDGTRWLEFHGGVASGNVAPGYIRALAAQGSDLYVGGSFNIAGGSGNGASLAVNVAHWNGAAWSGPLQNLNDPVYSLAVQGTGVYLGGSFTNAGGIFLPGLARWSGVSAASLFQAGLFNGEVEALWPVGSNVYAGGAFTQIDDKVMNHVACRMGTNWVPVGSGEGLSPSGRAAAANTEGVFVGGTFTGAGGSAAGRIARWNGSAWSSLGSGLKGTNDANGTLVNAIALRGPEVFVCGLFTNAGGTSANSIARWHTQIETWSALGSGVDGLVTTMAASADRVYIGGGFSAAGGVPVNRFASWDGLAWADVGGGVNSNVSVIVISISESRPTESPPT